MQQTSSAIAPKDIIAEFVKVQDQKPAARADALWDALGEDTIKVMADGAICLAQLWDSAWKEGAGDNTIHDLGVIDESALETLYQNPQFLPSKTLDQIGPILKGGPAPAPTATKPKRKGQPRRSTKRSSPARRTPNLSGCLWAYIRAACRRCRAGGGGRSFAPDPGSSPSTERSSRPFARPRTGR
jgi:hypothetical protein